MSLKKKKERKKERMSLYFSKCGEDAEKLDHSHIADRNTKWHNDLENNLAASYKVKHKPTV